MPESTRKRAPRAPTVATSESEVLCDLVVTVEADVDIGLVMSEVLDEWVDCVIDNIWTGGKVGVAVYEVEDSGFVVVGGVTTTTVVEDEPTSPVGTKGATTVVVGRAPSSVCGAGGMMKRRKQEGYCGLLCRNGTEPSK